ncbi:hypothetical protein GGI04_000982 [Coemansia thaxteri]|uniref:Uncharacterized protein n=1 Tax=Coemansia thaxteri TaxID=2663907 RepID=A0A9W8BLK0_9FUNG|nr:hypothetical protein H4R26_001030 [Coemansia thaxteri]KAJ2008788.1 hypothetical protein GGI04_000982 [Coemansia thaxteri]KAJ2467743.1 hypothetical protein GGI02_003929 [Coemansia sp. RSA 2322]KAJ2487108.1 hypothetical protein EV174_000719 [Coemansia sp. RSA 2320]
MESVNASEGHLRRSSSSRLAVQCCDPDLKREALSELFDHCMTPITVVPAASARCMSSLGSPVSGGCRARPLSAAPGLLLNLDIVEQKQQQQQQQQRAASAVNTGLLSPASPPSNAELMFYDQLYADEDEEVEDDDDENDLDGQLEEQQPLPALGTFADLRRKLYGGDVHGAATTTAEA